MAGNEGSAAALAKVLAHPARRRIPRLLQAKPGCIGGDFVGVVGLALSTVSEHLRVLKATGIITGEIDGPRICSALKPAALAPLADFIAGLTPTAGSACCVPTAKDTQGQDTLICLRLPSLLTCFPLPGPDRAGIFQFRIGLGIGELT
ncbi:ArsR/SmtB family transcription factor [Albidovulum sediminis]|uniref:Helix-turn-helix domain-containing protein n=1 Tax=Albidovulum sediminis TaxID=3066345 RepID=A0ABT2NVE6_9RHOB|nr:metalloregulator ArsR/SmtB family transcription factor [Defluviimonas sediminis]MCT8331475.1 helix-turn-helix domain-containing protein [Defluviimonas sediminis]